MINLSYVTFLLVFNFSNQQVSFSTCNNSLNELNDFLKSFNSDGLKIAKIKIYDAQKHAFKATTKERLMQCTECNTELSEMLKKLL